MNIQDKALQKLRDVANDDDASYDQLTDAVYGVLVTSFGWDWNDPQGS